MAGLEAKTRVLEGLLKHSILDCLKYDFDVVRIRGAGDVAVNDLLHVLIHFNKLPLNKFSSVFEVLLA